MVVLLDQAVDMALEVVGDPHVPALVRRAALEVVMFQRFEIGLLNDALVRWDEPVEGGGKATGWMGQPVEEGSMPGLRTDAQMRDLSSAGGNDQAASFLALMSRHHQGGALMGESAATNGRDKTMTGIARSMPENQRA